LAARNRIPYQWVDLEKDQDAETLLRELHVRPEQTPVVICPAGQVLRNPSNAELAQAVGLPAPRAGVMVCDLAVAAGDVRSGSIKRVTSAVGEGAAAVQLVWEYLQSTGRAANDTAATLT
jgi:hypothetical protein